MKQNRKVIVFVIIAILVVAIATASAIYFINPENKQKTSDTKLPETNKPAAALRNEAEAARKANNIPKALTLLSEAKEKLAEQPKSDENTNAQIDVAAQQCIMGVKSACDGH